MTSSISMDTCDIALYASSCSSNSLDYLESPNISGTSSFRHALEYGKGPYSTNIVNVKYENEKLLSGVPNDILGPEKDELSASVPETHHSNNRLDAINDGIHSDRSCELSCAESQNMDEFSAVLGSAFSAKYYNDSCQGNKDYQLIELNSISGHKNSVKIGGNEDFSDTALEILDGNVVVATSCVKICCDGGESKLSCSECVRKFPDRLSAIAHLTSHADIKPFHCINCNASSSTEAEARLHFKTHVESGQSCALSHTNYHECSQCGKVFESVESLSKHKQLHSITDDQWHLCSHCNKGFNSLSLLEKHTTLEHFHTSESQHEARSPTFGKKNEKRERKWICEVCQKAFRSSRALLEHEVVHTGARNFPCKICRKAFGTAANMRIHLATHSDQKPFSCLTCGARFRQKDSLKVHIRKHTGERPFVCHVCKMAFDRNFTLKNHMLTHSEKSFVCSVCGKAFSTRGGLNNHERLHFKDPSQPKKERLPRAKSGTGNWVCDECGKIYSSRSNLKLHKKSHEPTQICHVCPVCSQSYKSRDSLGVHMRRHTEERPFKCTMCSRSFYRNYTLKIHILTHTGEKPHHCPIEGCSKSFAQSSSLSCHVRNHKKKEERSLNQTSGKRPYRKRKAILEDFDREHAANTNINLGNREHPQTGCESGNRLTEDLKITSCLMSHSIAENIDDPGVQSMFDDISNNMAHQMELSSVWGDNESVAMLGVVNGLTSQHQTLNHPSIGLDLQQQHCQQAQLMQYVPSETLPLLPCVPDNILYEQDTVHKVLLGQSLLSPHLP